MENPESAGTSADQQTTPLPKLHVSPGARLGRYSILGAVGAGGMGTVYRARDEKLERDVAIKVLNAGLLVNDDARRHFRREALALAKLNHPHIATVYDTGEEHGIDYIVMELVEGEALSVKLRTGRMDAKDATSIALQVAEGLEEAHERGVIHRDLKPANIMITPRGRAKVLDFGLAKLFARGAGRRALHDRGAGRDGHADVYVSRTGAMGKASILARIFGAWARCITNRWRVDLRSMGKSGLATMRAIVDSPLLPLRQVRSDAPIEAEQIAARALEKDPDRRYQSAAEFAHDTRRPRCKAFRQRGAPS